MLYKATKDLVFSIVLDKIKKNEEKIKSHYKYTDTREIVQSGLIYLRRGPQKDKRTR